MTGDPSLRWEPLIPDDAPAISRIANDIHVDLPERIEVFHEKIRLFPQGARKLLSGREIKGYAIAHPWQTYHVPPLDTFLEALPANADCLYVHDVAICPEMRGRRASAHYISHLAGIAGMYSIQRLACVSVYGTHVWWERNGFCRVHGPGLTEKLSSYGESACYMIAEL